MSTRSSSWASACAASGALALAWALSASCAGALEDGDRFAVLDGGDDAGPADAGDGGVEVKDAGIDGGADDAGTLDAGPPDAGCNALVTIIAPTCATALCHSAREQQGSLDLQSPGLPGRLIGVAASGGPGLLIDAARPDSSVLYLKVLSPPPFGAQMPLLGAQLTADQVACLRSWIHAAVGAP